MKTRELTVDKWLEHLERHPLPELMDEECLKALHNVRTEYGSAISHGAGLEVRLGSEERYTDYIMNIDTEEIPLIGSLWYELDYTAYKNVDKEKGDTIIPCYFANINTVRAGSYDELISKNGFFAQMIEAQRIEK